MTPANTIEIPTKKGTKTNERPGTRAEARNIRFSERDAAIVIGKLLHSAVANAEHNDGIAGDDLFVSACYADEGKTIRRFRPRARGRATRIRKRSCHIVIIVSRMPDAQLERRRAKDASRPGSRAARRAGQQAAEEQRTSRRRRRRGGAAEAHDHDHDHEEPTAAEVAAAEEEQGIVDQQAEALADVEEETAVADEETTENSAEEAGIVDQQEAAVEAAAEADDTDATDDEGEK
jgi:large subunit ribosomal protein L22